MHSMNRSEAEDNLSSNVMTATDPVCGMDVDPQQAEWTSEYKRQTYYFCAQGCKKQFDRNPERYLSKQA